MSDWEFLIDAAQEIYLPKLKHENISVEEFTVMVDKISSILIVASSIAEKEGEKKRWESEGLKIWLKVVDSPAGQKYFGKG